MFAVQRLVNRSAVRQAFHGHDIRLPRNFFDDLDQTVYGTLRRISEGDVEVEANDEEPERDFVKESVVKEALRGALGKSRVESGWVAYLNGVVADKVADAIKEETAGLVRPAIPVPSRILRHALRTSRKEKDPRFAPTGQFSVDRFFRLWQHPEFRQEWVEKSKYKGEFRQALLQG